MDAIQKLMADHRKVRNLFDQFKATNSRQHRIRIFGQIFAELQAHTHVEEKVFYPACVRYPECKELVETSLEDHRMVKGQLARISALSQNSDDFSGLVLDLMEDVEDHVEEEETELFPKAREAMSAALLNELVEKMESARREVSSEQRSAA